MIGRRELDPSYERWNHKWGSPYGHRSPYRRAMARVLPRSARPRLLGPFAFQPDNNRTRRFEYPWAFSRLAVFPGVKVLEVGGSLSGLQFALSQSGARVTNADPAEAAPGGWPLSERTFDQLNRAFRTDVRLRRCYVEDASFDDDSFDRVLCLSTLEHVSPDALRSLLRELRRVLRPGGLMVLTVDLFFDLAPFTTRESNRHGRNVNIYDVVAQLGFDLVEGDPAELCGFPEFSPIAVLEHLDDLLWGDVAPCVAQCLVVRKPAA